MAAYDKKKNHYTLTTKNLGATIKDNTHRRIFRYFYYARGFSMKNFIYFIELLPAFIVFTFHRADIVNRFDYEEESKIF